MSLFTVKSGFSILTETSEFSILTGATAPNISPGIPGELGSVFFLSDGITYKKTDSGDTDWTPYSEIEGGGLLWEITTSNVNALSSKGYVLDPSASFTVTLPASPELGDVIGIAGLDTISTYNVTINLNSNLLNGLSNNINVSSNFCYFELLYTGDPSIGWVLSNNNYEPTVFTEENIITSGDSLQDSIDKIDITTMDVINFVGTDITSNNMPTFSSLSGVSGISPTYTPDNIIDEENLFISTVKLDEAIQNVQSIAEAGVFWNRDIVDAVTSEDPTGKTSGPFSDDETPIWNDSEWVSTDQVLSTNSSVLGHIFEWDGTTWIDTTEILQANEAVSCRFDFLDSPGTQENGAAYKMNSTGTEIIKIADFDFETAKSISLSSTYVPGSGNPLSSDSVETAIQKVDGNNDAQDSVLGMSQGSVNLGNSSNVVLTDNTTVSIALQDIDTNLSELHTFIGYSESTPLPNYSALAGSTMPADYVPINIVDDDNLELSIAKLDNKFNNQITTIPDGSDLVIGSYPVSNIGAKYFVFIYDGSNNRYATELFILNTITDFDYSESLILRIGNINPSWFNITVQINLSNVEIKLENNSGNPLTTKTQRLLF